MKGLFISALFYYIIIICNGLYGQDKLIQILDEELYKEFNILQKEEYPPYYMNFRVNDIRNIIIVSSFGSLIQSNSTRNRMLISTIRVGDYSFDNTHIISDDLMKYQMGNGNGYSLLPVDDDPYAIKQAIWKSSDWAYTSALNNYKKVKEVGSDDKDSIPDFSKEKPNVYYTNVQYINNNLLDIKEWETRLKMYTDPFVNDTSIIKAEAYLSVYNDREHIVSTEGTKIVQNFAYTQLHFETEIKSNDGDEIIPYYKSYYAFTPSGLPNNTEILNDVKSIMDILQKLKDASLAEPYTGPAILSSEASGVFFHEIFGHRIEGHRLKNSTDAQTFKNKIGTYVLPKEFNIVFDPSVRQYDYTDLFGYYEYDDEGIAGQNVEVVIDGKLNAFLMSRTPIKGFDQSTGHGRAQVGLPTVTRQSNMFVSTKSGLTDSELRKKLLKECKKQKKEYGYYFKEVIGGFTTTNRYLPNVFNIIPIEVYKIYLDGRPDELVRGVSLIGTPLTMFSNIEAAGIENSVFNGFCGAESGRVPVSTVSPALFVKQIETQLKQVSKIDLPLLSRPGISIKNEKN